jgi:flagellar hook-associated protein 1 FlgK
VREVNALHQTGYTLNKSTGINFFNPAGTDAAHISLADPILADAKNIAPAQGGTSAPATVVPAGGMPAQGAPTYDLKLDDPRYRYVAQGSVEITLSGTGEILREGAGQDYIVDYTLGTVTFLNYARFAGGEAISIDFRFEENGFPGNGDGANALAIAQLRQLATLSPDPNGNPTQTFGDYYSAMVGTLGIARNQNTTNLETKEFLIAQMDEEQASIAGVSLDEEMTNLIRFQHSYQASARIVGTVQEMMDTLMNM